MDIDYLSSFRMQDFLRKSTICLCIVFMFGAAFVMVEFFSVTSFTSGRFLTALTRSELDTGREHISEIKNTVKENKTTTKITTRKTPTHYASVNFEGRLGNQIFEFASLFGIARQNNLIPIIPANSLLRRIFKVSVGNTNPQIKLTKKYYEKKCCVFEPPLMSVGESEN